jgi:hypothetical protein
MRAIGKNSQFKRNIEIGRWHRHMATFKSDHERMRAGKVVSISARRQVPAAKVDTPSLVVTFAKRPPGDSQVRVKRLERVRNDRLPAIPHSKNDRQS